MRPKPRLLLLDAGAIIAAMQFGVWEHICSTYEVLVPSTVIRVEAQFYKNQEGNRVEIDLIALVTSGRITEISASVSEIASLRNRFDLSFREGLHDGESEALAYLLANPRELAGFVTGDGPAWKALAMLDLGDRAWALEEALQRSGRTVNNLPRQHKTAFKDQYVDDGNRCKVTREGFAK